MADTRFKKGHKTWNKDMKGIHLSPTTEFKKGQVAHNKKPSIEKICSCGAKFYVKPSLNRVVSCSRRCARLGKTTSQRQKDRAREVMTGNKFAAGRIAWNKGMVGFLAGEKHYNWKKDRSKMDERHRLRGTTNWKEWRSAVFARDNFTCIDCGAHGVYLEPHHIIPLKHSLSRAFDITNGITLCRPCHQKTMGKELQLARTYFSLIPAQV